MRHKCHCLCGVPCDTMSNLHLKFGGLTAVVVCWSLLMVYLVNLLDWVPAPFAILQSPGDTVTRPATTLTTTTTMSHQPRDTTPTESRDHQLEAAHVLIASDGLCLGGLVSAINSVLIHTKHTIKFYIITTAEELAHLRIWIEATKLHKMTYELHTLTALTRNVTGGLQRIKIRATELFPELWGRLVYLDCDVIVQGDIWELFTTDIQPGHYGAFSQNCVGPVGRVVGLKPRYSNYINLRHSALHNSTIDPNTCPFATGVFVANLTLWKRHNIVERVQHWIKLHKREKIVGTHPAVDVVEAAMLIVLYGKVTVLNSTWNVQHLGESYSSRYSKQFIERAKLLHWSGRFKPWSHRAAHAEVWDRYYIPDPTAQFRPARKRG